jgi:hypothetical protein
MPPLPMMDPRSRCTLWHGRRELKESPVIDSDNVFHMPTSVQTALPEAVKTLEQAWQRRRQELADWQPSGGWLVEQRNVASVAGRASARPA